MHVEGIFDRFPGFPQGVHLVMNLARYQEATGLTDVDSFLLRTKGHGHGALSEVSAALRNGPGAKDPINIESTETALDKDQSSLTALDVNGLVDLDSLYTLLMGVAVVAIFVVGLMLQRRREYVVLRALGMSAGQIRAVVLAEAAAVAVGGLVVGLLVGTVMAFSLVHVLRPLFILDPALTVTITGVAPLVLVTTVAAVVAALGATASIGRLRPTELLRDP